MILFFCILGCACGIIAGLIPGLHSNNIAVLLATSPFFGMEVTAFMLSLCTVQAFVDFIPSTFLSAPSENTFEGVLPGHKMLLEGKGVEAICLTTAGALVAVIIGSILTPLFFMFIEQNSEQLIQITPLVLITALITFVIWENGFHGKIIALFVIIAAGTQGILFQDQVFPLITGYFGVAGTLYALSDAPTKIKQNQIIQIKLSTLKDSLAGIIGGAIVAIMPGIGSNTAAGIINLFKNKDTAPNNTEKYLAMLGAINVSNFFFSFATLLALSKARNGAMLAIQDKILYSENTLFFGTLIMFISAGIGGISAIWIAKKAATFLDKNKTKILSIGTIVLMISLVGILNGLIGLIALFFSTALGLFVLTKKAKRSLCMSSLIVPTLFFYLFILL
ncbi:MAG: tripartite tricarboxylate transporter permease [archaeon]|jgi:putative membrane protein